jgi:hypothetical protein
MSRLPFADQPQETRFFLLIFGWAGVLGVIYWIVSGEVAGTALLAGLALATGVLSVWLLRTQRPVTSDGGTAGVDRPFLDEEGRLPAPTLAPFAVGLGVALAALGPVFGLAPVAVGAVSLLWGAGTWLGSAREEFGAQERDR